MRTKTIRKKGTIQKVFKWTANDVRKKMEQIAKQEKCDLVFLNAGEGFGGCNYGCCAGKSIMLAPFIKVKAGEKVDGFEYPHGCSNPVECQFIAFFHELAHIKLANKVPSNVKGYSWNDTSRFQYELWLTMLGVEHAHKKYDIKFSDEALDWMIEEAKSYVSKDDSDVGYGLHLLKSDENGYEVKSQWEFKGQNK
jgi:hypothetical protein